MTKLLTTPGDTLTEGFGPDLTNPTLLVTMTREHNGIAIQTSDGVQVIDELTRTFTVWEHAAGFYRLLRDTANAGKRTYQIVAEAKALVELMNIDTARTAEQVRDSLRAEVDARQAEVTTAHNRTVAVVAEVMAGATETGGWVGARKTAQTTARATSQPMDRILAQAEHDGGRIARSRQATSTQLVALANRGLVDLVYGKRGNTRYITGATLVRTLGQVAA